MCSRSRKDDRRDRQAGMRHAVGLTEAESDSWQFGEWALCRKSPMHNQVKHRNIAVLAKTRSELQKFCIYRSMSPSCY